MASRIINIDSGVEEEQQVYQDVQEVPVWARRQHPLVRWALIIFMVALAVVMMFPFAYVLWTSFASFQDAVSADPLQLPRHPTLEGYQWLFNGGIIIPAFGISILVTVLATAIGTVLVAGFAYGLSLRGLPGGKFFLWFVLLTLLITSGIIPQYLLIQQMKLLDSIWAMVLPGAVSGFHIIIMRQFFLNVPQELIDSARIDGANDWQILWRVMLPLSKAVLAVVALFEAVAHWNNFFRAVIYISDPSLFPLALVLRQLVLQGQSLTDQSSQLGTNVLPPPSLALQMAAVVITTIPILLVYPFLQKHFTKGVLTGSIKG
jgi:putative aldouronate transport system permease protein